MIAKYDHARFQQLYFFFYIFHFYLFRYFYFVFEEKSTMKCLNLIACIVVSRVMLNRLRFCNCLNISIPHASIVNSTSQINFVVVFGCMFFSLIASKIFRLTSLHFNRFYAIIYEENTIKNPLLKCM